MSMNHYWEKYKNRNKSQDTAFNTPDKQLPTSLILDHLSAVQSQLNTLESKFLDLNCKFNGLNSYEAHSFALQNPLLEKIERIEKSLEFKSEIDQRVLKLEENNNFIRMENLRLDIIKELSLTEARIAESLKNEILNIKKKVSDVGKENKKNSVKVEENAKEGKLEQEWQKKIERIVVACGERMKKIEENFGVKGGFGGEIENLREVVNKFKGFQGKIVKKVEEIEEFSRKLCRKIIEKESEGLLVSPISKGLKKDESLCMTQQRHKRIKDEVKHIRNCSSKMNTSKLKFGSPSQELKNTKTMNKLERLYEELNDF